MTPTDKAAQALDAFADGPAMDSAEAVAQAFESAGDRITDALERAARSGELSFNALAESIALDLSRLAINELIVAPLEGVLGQLGQSLIGGSGSAGKQPVNITMNVTGGGDAESFRRSENQIASRLTDAVRRGGNRT